jgi:hypothetical protein
VRESTVDVDEAGWAGTTTFDVVGVPEPLLVSA